jgi:hypothetical protein
MKVFNEYLGYCGSIPFLADFERKLDESGKYQQFKDKFFEINGSSWEEAREDYYFIQDEIIEAVSALGIMSEEAARNWAANAESSYSFSIDQFADYVRKYCSKKGENHHVVFLVDEIGQYIADDSKLMVNLQTVAEDLGTACQGKVWIAVTSQQDIDSITKTMGDDFSKIQGRFNTRVSLTSADVAEVIRKRILYKKDNAQAAIQNSLQNSEYTISTTTSATERARETRKKDKYVKQLNELRPYYQALSHIALQRIQMDLDDGVKKNYQLFQGVEVSTEGKKKQTIDLLAKI